jgi:hypothetical protein
MKVSIVSNPNVLDEGFVPDTLLFREAQMKVTPDQVKSIAQGYLDGSYHGTVAEEVNQFYGYYTVHVTKGRTLFGMLSVNGYSGVVWYHSWHGAFIQSREVG